MGVDVAVAPMQGGASEPDKRPSENDCEVTMSFQPLSSGAEAGTGSVPLGLCLWLLF